mmetsp:Transcript_31751/g.31028  ORF Transcript_31751/g.31028 Transcript_31751/m.31028 type:complete len:116 (+) Transcript_31751:2-349(+)
MSSISPQMGRKILLQAAVAMAAYGAKLEDVYLIPYDCMNSHTNGVSLTLIEDKDTLGDFNFGMDITIEIGDYCYHQFFYQFMIEWTVAAGDDSALYFANYVPMEKEGNFDMCAPT